MKKLLMFAGLLALAGCSKKQPEQIPAGADSELTLSGKTVVITPAAGSDRVTKANEMLRETEIGIYVLQTSGENQTDFGNARWKNQLFNSDNQGIMSTVDPIILRSGTTYAIYAYAPRIDGLTTDGLREIPVNHGEDLLWAKKEEVTAGAGGTAVSLAFEHVGAQIAFRLVGLAESTTTVEVEGFSSAGTYDLETGTVTISPAATPVTITNTMGEKYNFIAPTGGEVTLNVTVTSTSGKVYTGTHKQIFTRGTSYMFNIDVDTNVDGLTFTAEISDWMDTVGDGPVIVG